MIYNNVHMVYVLFAPLILLMIVVLSIILKSCGVFLALKIFGVEGNTCMRAVKIILWQIVYFIPVVIIYGIMSLFHVPLWDVIGLVIFVVMYFWTMHILCKKYFHTDLGKNSAIAIVSALINTIFGLILMAVIMAPIGVWMMQHGVILDDGVNRTFHMDRNYEGSTSATINLGTDRSHKERKIINLKELLHLQ